MISVPRLYNIPQNLAVCFTYVRICSYHQWCLTQGALSDWSLSRSLSPSLSLLGFWLPISPWLHWFRDFQVPVVQYHPQNMNSPWHPTHSLTHPPFSSTSHTHSVNSASLQLETTNKKNKPFWLTPVNKSSLLTQSWHLLKSRVPREKYCYGWLHRRLLRRYRPQSAVSCSTLWEQTAGSPPSTRQVSLNSNRCQSQIWMTQAHECVSERGTMAQTHWPKARKT